MALKDQVPDILAYIRDHQERLTVNNTLFEVYEGALIKYVEKSLQTQLSAQPYMDAKERIPGINIIRKVVNKLSRIYLEPPMRVPVDPEDKEILDYYTNSMHLNSFMHDSNVFFNLCKNSALEPFIEDGEPKIRVIPSHQFLVMSDDIVNPTRPTVFIKCMGQRYTSTFSPDTNQETTQLVNVYWLYTDTEFLAIDETGAVQEEDMQGTEGVNPYGKIPFIYVNRSRYQLMPNPDTDMLRMGILIPILLADINFAAKYQTFSIVYGIDLDVENLNFGPNALWNFKSDAQGIKPEVGTIKPSADLIEMIQSIQNQLGMWFETRDLKATTVGNVQVENAASGIALLIQNLDTSEDRKVQTRYFQAAEQDLWTLLAKNMHPYWVEAGLIDYPGAWMDDKVIVKFPEIRPLKTEQELITNVVMKLGEGLVSRRQALQEVYPDFTEVQIDSLIKEIDKDSLGMMSQAPFMEQPDLEEDDGDSVAED